MNTVIRHHWRWILSALLLGLLPLQLRAESGYQEGVHYQKLESAVITRDPGKIEVIEVFWYVGPLGDIQEPAMQHQSAIPHRG